MEILCINRPLVAALIAAFITQFLKPFLLWPFEKKFHAELFISTGGMPSSHTAMVVALSTSILIIEGVQSLAFAIALTFSLIVIHDAMGIRRAAGKQAEVINEWSRILTQIHEAGQFNPENLKTMLGHSFMQVLGGTVIGLLCGYISTIM
ncbi:MAG: divergent PAP2 family protein [Sphaerochaetaceae bacterium]|jgi:acid phosphatase family membrane protein YuiD|nr:divergent PAP2 family protein [Sphaerochaetaceae bacterium]MDD4220497.1 divergent PAP2 family protein [Sphaerochaetaceae bacterium]MDY0371711.1 divergent PAP2 family protein [Sphaerochaetaceae bacterium]